MADFLRQVCLIAVTLAAYLGIRRLYLRYNHPLLNVVALSAALVIGVLVACDIPYTAYAPAKDTMNEELQSSNEEMEASREELQALNEELTTLNLELQTKIEEVGKAQAFVENLLAATNLATVVLDQSLTIMAFLKLLVGKAFLILEGGQAGRKPVKIDEMSVEFRSIHTGEPGLAAHTDATGAAHDLFGQPGDGLAEVGRQLAHKVVGQQRDILGPVAQRRQPHLHDFQPVVQVGPEKAGPDAFGQIHIGGGDHPHVGLAGFGFADPLEFLGFKHAQQPQLQAW